MLLPFLEAQTEVKLAGSTIVTRKEHRRIEVILDRLSRFISTRQCAAILQSFDGEPDEPSAVFANHDSQENVIPYPSMDREFDPVERRELLSAKTFEI